MIRQKPISARVNLETHAELEQEAYRSGDNKNYILNEALRLYIWMQDLRRAYTVIGKEADLNTLLDKRRASAPRSVRWLIAEFCDK